MIRLFDSHAHYDDEKYEGDREAVIADCFEKGVTRIINCSITPGSAKRSLAFAERYEPFYAAVGIHPENCGEFPNMEATLGEIRELLSHPKAVAVGEIGLDYYWKEVPSDVQKAWFEAQLQMAEELRLPVIIHDREAHGDCMDAVYKHPKVKGVFHSFSGSAEMAKDLVRRGWYISFSGSVTFKNAAKLPEAVKEVPMDRILSETDCPYLTPHPHRGERNSSAMMALTVAKLAELKQVSYEEMCEQTYQNACRLFSVPL